MKLAHSLRFRLVEGQAFRRYADCCAGRLSVESLTGCAVHTMLEAGIGYGTIDLRVKMLRPVPRDVNLVAEGRVIHLSKNLGVAEGTLKTPDGKIVAHASATCLIQHPS